MFNGNKHPRNSSDWEQQLKLKDLPTIFFFLFLLSAISFSTAILMDSFYFSIMYRILWEIRIEPEPFLPFIRMRCQPYRRTKVQTVELGKFLLFIPKRDKGESLQLSLFE